MYLLVITVIKKLTFFFSSTKVIGVVLHTECILSVSHCIIFYRSDFCIALSWCLLFSFQSWHLLHYGGMSQPPLETTGQIWGCISQHCQQLCSVISASYLHRSYPDTLHSLGVSSGSPQGLWCAICFPEDYNAHCREKKSPVSDCSIISSHLQFSSQLFCFLITCFWFFFKVSSLIFAFEKDSSTSGQYHYTLIRD